MSIENALYYELTNDSTINSKVGTRVYPFGEVPMSASLPFITYHRVDVVPTLHLANDSNVDKARIQIDCWAESQKEASELAIDVRNLLQFKKGNFGDPANYEYVRGVFLESFNDLSEVPTDASQKRIHRTQMDFVFIYDS